MAAEHLSNGTTPQKGDSIRFLMVRELLATVAGGGGGGTGGVYKFNGDPTGVVVPTQTAAIGIQLDSVPPNQLWTWDGSNWS